MGLAVFTLFVAACISTAVAAVCCMGAWLLIRHCLNRLLRVLAVLLLLLGLGAAAGTLWLGSLIWSCLHFF